jgi:hypothetical protein
MMNKQTVAFSLVSTLLLAGASNAFAEPTTGRSMPAVTDALEITAGASIVQGSGELGGDLGSVRNVAGSGLGFDTSIGWRITPNLLLGGYLNLSGFGDSDNADHGAVTVAAGIKADWHFLPAESVDPWVSLGTGWKLMGIEDGDNDRALTGLELAKLQVGIDYRLSPRFAIGPVISASAAMFNTQYDEKMSDDAMALDDRQINWTFTAGVLGRFDAFGSTH